MKQPLQWLARRPISFGLTRRSHIGRGGWLSLRPIQRYSYCGALQLHLLTPRKVTKLCGPEPLTKYVVLFVVALQVVCAYLLKDTSFFSWKFFLTAYVVGATANQNCFLAIHEISHNLAFRSPMANRLLAIFANLPIGIPYSASFRVSVRDLSAMMMEYSINVHSSPTT